MIQLAFKSDATSSIANGGTTTEDTVVFGATLNSSSTNSLRLEVEYTTSTSFTGIANATSAPVSPGTFATATVSGLVDGNYHWRARAVDASTSVSSAWVDLGNGSNPDFVVHQVPLYTQVVSQFPSIAATTNWAGDTYANGLGNAGPIDQRCGIFIRTCGCAIASVVMLSKYYGLNSGADDNSLTPKNINIWLETANADGSLRGYDSHGNVIWPQAAKYAQDISQSIGLHFDKLIKSQDTTTLDQRLTILQPQILYIRSVGHFIVANSKLATTYALRDPDFYTTKTLNDNLGNSSTTHQYGNHFDGLRIFSPTTTGLSNVSQGIYLNLGSPAELLVTDPNGNKVGKDPVTNISYDQITDAAYDSEGISDGSVVNPSQPGESKFVWIPNPIAGSYNVQVIGTASGTYTFNSLVYDASSTAHTQVFDGTTQTNLVTPYSLNYTPQSSSTIVVTSQLVFGGFLDPIKADGTGLYKQGRTLPVKFQLTNTSSTILANHTAQLFLAKIQDNVVGTDEVALSTSNADTGNFFRVSGNDYIYNLDTGLLSVGTWQLKALLDDGTSHTVIISIKS